jgi:hypothetical protein
MITRVRQLVLIAVLLVAGVALVGAALWFVGPTFALFAFLFVAVVIVPSCIQILKELADDS